MARCRRGSQGALRLLAAGVPLGLACAVAAEPSAPNAVAPPEGLHRPRIALVLSGGGARGAAHIGVLKALEEMRVPVDLIVGTSMGSIVGGSYASGTTVQEMEDRLASSTTGGILHERLPRQDDAIHRKKEDSDLFVGPEFGVAGGTLRLPIGAISGIRLEADLRNLAKAPGFHKFDDLPIPFRAVATDVVAGEMVVFDQGELATVMRASMSVPGLIAPIEIQGRVLIDGGLTRNLPIDVARATDVGVDVVIAVNLGTPLLKRDEISSLVGVTTQMINILKEQNVQISIAAMKPGDVLISPDLGNYSASDFDHMASLVPLGEAAAHKMAPQLARFSLPPDEYAMLRARQVAKAPSDPRAIDEIRFEGLTHVNPAVLQAAMETKAGAPVDPAVLDTDIRRLYGRGDFEHINYRVLEEQGRHILAVEALEKSWGPDYVRFGLGLASDFQSDTYFNIGARYRRTWLNALGGEWRVDGQIGRTDRLASEFYQPLDPSGVAFVAPYLSLERRPLDLFAGSDRIARFNFSTDEAGLDVGATMGKWGELRAGPVFRRVRTSLDTGLPIFTNDNDTQRGLRARVLFDQIDNLDFPRRGVAATLNVFDALGGSEPRYVKYQADAQAAYTVGPHTVQLGFEAAGAASGSLPSVDLIEFGGFQQLSGYRTGQLLGQKLAFGRAVYVYKLFDQRFLEGAYVGASLEAGRVDPIPITGAPTGLLVSGSVFLALDTLLGPLYLAYGYARDGNSSAYLFLGRP